MGYKYYSLKPILSKNCRYNIIFGERSRGKTTAILEYCITHKFAETFYGVYSYVLILAG